MQLKIMATLGALALLASCSKGDTHRWQMTTVTGSTGAVWRLDTQTGEMDTCQYDAEHSNGMCVPVTGTRDGLKVRAVAGNPFGDGNETAAMGNENQ